MRGQGRPPAPVELALDLVYEVEVQLEEPAHEPGDEQQGLALERGEAHGRLRPRRQRVDVAEVPGDVALEGA